MPNAAATVTLDALRDEIQRNQQRLAQLSDRVSTAQAGWSPDPKRWSITHCIDHLAVANRQYLPRMVAAVEKGRRRGRTGHGPFRHRWVMRFAIGWIEPPPGLRVPAPRGFAPSATASWPATQAAYHATAHALLALLESAEGLDFSRLIVVSPESRLIRFRLSEAYAFLAAHDRRHLWQAEQVLDAKGYPQPDVRAAS